MRILIAMSGGVDSSVSAYLMHEKYRVCRGATMLLSSYATENISDAKKICERLEIQHEILNYTNDFEECVIKKFVKVYEAGGTPNPCIECNRFMKFGKFLRQADEIEFEKIATGHYAKIEHDNDKYFLRKAKDLSRDQSYVLYMLTQNQLARVEFPLGDMKKSEARDLAGELNFINARKSDSQDICFVPDNNYAAFIENYTGKKYQPGNFIDESGKILGLHNGIIHYTLGQRRGLGVAAKSRLYISRINTNDNTITLSEKALLTRKIRVVNVNLIALNELPKNFHARVKTRYRQNEIPAVINQIDANELIIEFHESIKAPARGQAAVIYDNDYVIGGGTIADIIISKQNS